MFQAVQVKTSLIAWIRDWFEKNGTGCSAVIGISGGKDSSVCAALCLEALGKERVIGVLMPNNIQSDIADSLQLVEHLGIRFFTIPVSGAVKEVQKALECAGIAASEL